MDARGLDQTPRSGYVKTGKSRIDGEQSREYFKAYYEENKEKILARNKAARQKRAEAGIKNRVSTTTWRSMVLSLLRQRDGDQCGICGQGLDFTSLSEIHIDHKIPYWFSQDDSAENLRLAHKSCNMQRSRRYDDKSLDQ